MVPLLTESVVGIVSFVVLYLWKEKPFFISFISALLLAYLPQYFNGLEKKGGNHWRTFQDSYLFKLICSHNPTTITVEEPLHDDKLYIFCSFPHGSVNHVHTMSNGSGFISKVHAGPRRDLCASVLFWFPILREALLYLGCVDASPSTAKYNLKRSRSLLIFIGGEKEQLMTHENQHKIFLKSRKGFVKLALEFGADLVPMYAFGENELYHHSNFMMGFRQWLQRNFHLGIPIVFGWKNTMIPYAKPMGIEIGAPVQVKKKPKAEITAADIDRVHAEFMNAMTKLFDRTKERNGVKKETKLEIC